jgi:hypothetical protein
MQPYAAISTAMTRAAVRVCGYRDNGRSLAHVRPEFASECRAVNLELQHTKCGIKIARIKSKNATHLDAYFTYFHSSAAGVIAIGLFRTFHHSWPLSLRVCGVDHQSHATTWRPLHNVSKRPCQTSKIDRAEFILRALCLFQPEPPGGLEKACTRQIAEANDSPQDGSS